MRKPVAMLLAASVAISGVTAGLTPASAGMALIAPAVSQQAKTAAPLVEEVGHRAKRRHYHHRRHFNRRPHYRRHGHHRHYRHYRHRRDNNSAAAAAILGLGIGAIMGGALANSANQQSDWHAYCASKYRSYDPRTGTFLGYDGRRHPCR